MGLVIAIEQCNVASALVNLFPLPCLALAMSSKIPLPVVCLVGLVATLYILCSMVLISSGVAWISLQFTPTITAPLAFGVGSLSLLAAIVGILMEGVTRFTRCLGFTFLTLTASLILVSVGVLIPFVLLYNGANESLIGEYCYKCEQYGRRTQTCVDNCDDECCFTDTSETLATVIIAGAGVSLLTSIVGLGTAIAQLFFSFKLPSQPNKRL